MNEPDKKLMYYECDTRAHQKLVSTLMNAVAKKIMDKGINHDYTKFTPIEINSYAEPVWYLNTEKVPYGSARYKELTKQMGEGLKHHKQNNDHHPEFFEQYAMQTLNDPIRAMDLFAIIEMLCDWIAASKRRGNEAADAMTFLKEKYPIDEQLEAIMRNTLAMIERYGKEELKQTMEMIKEKENDIP